jgi:hypothetical protein
MEHYGTFASRDARRLATWLERDYDVAITRRLYSDMSLTRKSEFEAANATFIEELIQRTPADRVAYLKNLDEKLGTDRTTESLLIVFAIIGLLRLRALFEIRDYYRSVLVPGEDSRTTCCALYSFQNEVSGIRRFRWPNEAFDTPGSAGAVPEDLVGATTTSASIGEGNG